MREKLIQYVELLFTGSTVHDEVRQEILQNTLDRFDDLVEQGKQPEAAYQLAISGIGDLGEITGAMPNPHAPAETGSEQKKPSRKLITGIAVALYILCPVPTLIFPNSVGACFLFVFVAAATALLIWGGDEKEVRMSREEFEQLRTMDAAQLEQLSRRGELTKSINHLISVIVLVVYLAISFATGAWYITWVLFPMGGAVKGLVRAVMDLKEAEKMKRNAIVRICVYAGLILVLIAMLLVGVFGMRPRRLTDHAVQSEAAVPVTMPVEDRQVLATGKTKYDLDVFVSPTSGSLGNGRMAKGDSVNILEIVTTNGEDWAYVSGNSQGWVQLPLLELDGETVSEETIVVSDAIGIATATEKVNVRSAPSKGASVIGQLDTGSPVSVYQIQEANGAEWAYIGWGSNHGWVKVEYLAEIPTKITERHGQEGTATVKENLNLRASPSKDAATCGMLPKGSQPEVTQMVTVMGIEWAYVSLGEDRGWAVAEYLDVDENFKSSLEDAAAETQETVVTILEEGFPGLKKFHQDITGLNITWPSGKVTVETGDVELPEVQAEDGTAQCMVTEKGRLKIEAVSQLLSFKKKDLTVVFPANYEIEKLELDLASASAVIRDLPGTIKEVEIDTASGVCSLENLTVQELEIDSASGPVSFVGSVERLDFEGANAKFSAVISNHPKKMELTNETGKIILAMPQDFGFTAENKGKTGGFMTDFTDTKPGSNVFGDGSCKIEIDNSHGSIDIQKAS